MPIKPLELFEEKNVETLLYKKLLEIDYKFFKEIDKLKNEFIKDFKEVCCQIVGYQKNNDYIISYISFAPFLTDLIERNSICSILLYDNKWYGNEYVKIGEIDISYFYKELHEIWDKLLQERKKYVGKIYEPHVENIILRESRKFFEYFEMLLLYAIDDCILCEEFETINKTNDYLIYLGELLSNIKPIYEVSASKRDCLKFKDEIEDSKKLVNYILENEKIEDILAKEVVIQNCRFKGVNLKNSSFANSYIVTCTFDECIFEKVSLKNSFIKTIKFRECKLIDVDFSFAYCESGHINREQWERASNLESIFYNVNLTNVKFNNSVFIGIDFTSCNFENVDFTHAKLEKSIFTKKQVEILELSEKQMQMIEVR